MAPPDAVVIIIPGNVGGTTSPPYGQHNYPYPPPFPGIYITATPLEGYRFDYFTVNGVTTTANPTLIRLFSGQTYVVYVYWHAITPPVRIVTASHADYVSKTANVAVVEGAVSTLDFVLTPHRVALWIGKAGKGTTTPPLSQGYDYYWYDYSEVNPIEITAFPDTAAGFWFEGWLVDAAGSEEYFDTQNPIGLLPNKTRNLVAFFATSTVLLTITKTGEGTTDPPVGVNTIAYSNHNLIAITATPAPGYRFDSWYLLTDRPPDWGENYYYNDPSNPIELWPNKDLSLEAIFVLDTRVLTISTTAGGTTDPAPGSYTVTGPVTVTAIPEAGYRLSRWMLDGVNVGNPPSITVTMDGNHALEAFFEPIPVYSNVTISVVGQGTADPIGHYPDTYEIGDDLYVTATPATGWLLSTMRRNGVDWTSSSPGEFLNLQATEDINVVFEPIPPGKGVLECHAHVDGEVASATVAVAGVGSYTTPFSLELEPGNYTLNATYSGQSQTKTATIVEGETVTVEFQFTKPPPKECPFKNLESFPRLYKFLCDLWARQ